MTQATEKEVTPKLFSHCVRVYDAMKAQAKIDDDSGKLLYEGYLTGLVTGTLNLSTPYYTSTTRALKRMGCIVLITRGGGTARSVWEILERPTEPQFHLTLDDDEKTGTAQNRKVVNRRETLEEQVIALGRKHTELLSEVDKLKNMIIKMDQTVTSVNQRISEEIGKRNG